MMGRRLWGLRGVRRGRRGIGGWWLSVWKGLGCEEVCYCKEWEFVGLGCFGVHLWYYNWEESIGLTSLGADTMRHMEGLERHHRAAKIGIWRSVI
jgi:hypothetical protein